MWVASWKCSQNEETAPALPFLFPIGRKEEKVAVADVVTLDNKKASWGLWSGNAESTGARKLCSQALDPSLCLPK